MKKIMACVIAISFLLNVPTLIFANDVVGENLDTVALVETMIENINEEYNVSFFVPDAEIFPQDQPSGKIVTYEAIANLTAEELVILEGQLRQAATEIEVEFYDGNDVVFESPFARNTNPQRYIKIVNRTLPGARITLQGYVNRDRGYYVWEPASLWFSAATNVGGNPQFFLDSWIKGPREPDWSWAEIAWQGREYKNTIIGWWPSNVHGFSLYSAAYNAN